MSTRGLELDLSRGKRSSWNMAKRVLQRCAPTLLYRRPVSVLAPERLYAYLDALWNRRELDGDVVEIGSYLGGTAVIAYHMLRNIGSPKRYFCVDTFGGFVPDHFDRDFLSGTSERLREEFSGNSVSMVKTLLRSYDAEDIELVKGDIVSLPASSLPDMISTSLIDVDLEVPVYSALDKTYPRLVNGGILLVDDCAETSDYVGARLGYTRFVRDHGLGENFFLGFGVVHKE